MAVAERIGMCDASTPLAHRDAAIEELGDMLSGALQTCAKRCGQVRCECRDDPDARHGLQHKRTRRRDGRPINTRLEPAGAQIVTTATESYREVEGLLRVGIAKRRRSY